MAETPQTQTQIDNAVLLGKSSVANLAYELALELKYGGNIDCCLCNLGVIWGWTNALLCQKAIGSSTVVTAAVGTYTVGSSQVGQTINVYIDSVNISGNFTITSGTPSTTGSELATAINAYQSVYVATHGTPGPGPLVVTITGGCFNGAIVIVTTGTTSIVSTAMAGGVCSAEVTEEDNCLTDVQTKEVIGKINSTCKH